MLLFVLTGLMVSDSYAQSARKGSGEKSGSRRKVRKQMRHFDKGKEDKNIKSNGSSYWRSRKSDYKVDGDGFGVGSNDHKRKRKKKSGVK